jgi:hypothetical protein
VKPRTRHNRFVKWFLKNDPEWASQVDKVWEVYASDETIEIFVEADFETLAEERRRFAIINIPRNSLAKPQERRHAMLQKRSLGGRDFRVQRCVNYMRITRVAPWNRSH